MKNHGGVLVRLLSALDGFYAKHGYWPKRVSLGEGTLAALVTHHFTPMGFFQLQSRVAIETGPDGDVLAYGRGDDAFSYSEEMNTDAPEKAYIWLGLDQLH